jgi:peptidoglycan/LPS O-acetylase OafA/YrhL
LRHLALDLLRALAVLLVIGRHLEPGGVGMLRLWRRGGWVGVDLFFVLSGFLVAGLLLREQQRHGRIDIGRFFLRRGLKIYPAFYVFLAVTLPLAALLGVAPTATPVSVVSECCFLQSYLPGAWNHTWSLAVEEHFYLLLPLGLALLTARPSADPLRMLPAICIAGACTTLVLRVAGAWGRAYEPYAHHFPTHLRLDALGLGVAVAYYYHFRRDGFERVLRPCRRWLIGGGSLLLAIAFFARVERAAWVYTFGFSVFAVGSALLLCGLLLVQLRPGKLVRGLAAIGAQSYSIYLWHMPVILWGPALLERWAGVRLEPVAAAGWAVGASVVIGIGMARLVELPVLRWRDRLFPSRIEAQESPGTAVPGLEQPHTMAAHGPPHEVAIESWPPRVRCSRA